MRKILKNFFKRQSCSYRMGQEFKRNDVNLDRQNMAHWTIRCAGRYLAVMYGYLHKLLYGYHVLQADAYFVWLKEHQHGALPKSQTGKAFAYSLNQEKYLRVFLEDGEVPLDNNATEAALRGFCIGKNNWRLIDTISGANASAVIYSITETAKANGLKVYDYVEHLLTEIPKHEDDRCFSILRGAKQSHGHCTAYRAESGADKGTSGRACSRRPDSDGRQRKIPQILSAGAMRLTCIIY